MIDRFVLISDSFKNGNVLRSIYACPKNRQPHFKWQEYPEKTESFAIIMDDTDAIPVAGYIWVHWNLFNIPKTITSIRETQTKIENSTYGMNHFKRKDYSGPCPPKGTPHTYVTSIYALKRSLDNLDFETPLTRVKFENLFKKDILDSAKITCVFASS